MFAPLVAVIHSDEQVLTLFDEVLREEGYWTTCCSTSADGFEVVSIDRPDLVILDPWLETREAGWQLLERIRRDPNTMPTPILVCSADWDGLIEHADSLRSWGCGVLQMPFELDYLLAWVARMATPDDATVTCGTCDVDWSLPKNESGNL